jgi:hypothetical protein
VVGPRRNFGILPFEEAGYRLDSFAITVNSRFDIDFAFVQGFLTYGSLEVRISDGSLEVRISELRPFFENTDSNQQYSFLTALMTPTGP